MRTVILIIILFFAPVRALCQAIDTLYVNYIAYIPFAYMEGEELKCIEIDLIKAYSVWLKSKKNMSTVLKYSTFSNYTTLYEKTSLKSRKSFGLASAIISQEKNVDVDFSLPYIKNAAFCITNGNALEIKAKTPGEIDRDLGAMTALTIKNSSLNKYMDELKKLFIKNLQINFVESEFRLLDEVSKNSLVLAYVNGITFWSYLKNNPSKSLKIQRVMNQHNEEIGFILPKGCPYNPLFKEFFIHYKTTVAYRSVLEKYLGTFMTHNVAMK